MDILPLVGLASITTITLLILALRVMKWRTLIRYHWAADVGFTIGTFILLSGSMTGMLISIISGLMFSIVLSIGKWLTPKQ